MNIFRTGSIAAAIFAVTALAVPATAQTVTTLFSFQRPSGPLGRLLLDKSGALFGVEGGHNKILGQVYELSKIGGVWKKTVIHKFTGIDGEYPDRGLIEDSTGALYGVTSRGGTYGAGVVFKLAPSVDGWIETVLHNFGAPGDGTYPTAELTGGEDGTLYGTTSQGGAHRAGIAFELTQSAGVWTETILHDLGAPNDGQFPTSSLLMNSKGDFYGATGGGGTSFWGTLYELRNVGGVWTETVLYNFSVYPETPDILIRGSNGTFFGLSTRGGTGTCPTNPTVYCGTVFELIRSAGKWTKTVLHNFTESSTDGMSPIVLIWNSKTSTLYGITRSGGSATSCYGGCGTIFKMTQADGIWTENLLHSFGTGPDGWDPLSMIEDHQKGIFYGTTGSGQIFQMTP